MDCTSRLKLEHYIFGSCGKIKMVIGLTISYANSPEINLLAVEGLICIS